MRTPIENLPDDSIKSIAELVESAQTATSIGDGGRPYLLMRSDQHVEDVEKFLLVPTRKTGNPQFVRMASFVTYVLEHTTPATRIYTNGSQLTAVFDHHGATPGWGQHRATYTMKPSLEWLAWTEKDRQKMAQKEFCEFIEDNNANVVGRTDMVELVRTLQVNSAVDFKSFERGDNGNASLMFVKTMSSRAGEKGEIELPTAFNISIPAFEGGELKVLTAKLRFDIGDGKLKLWYELQHVQKTLNDHIDAVVAAIFKATNINPFYGTP